MGTGQIDGFLFILSDGCLIYSMRFYSRGQNSEILSQSFKQFKLEPGSLATAKGYSFAMLSKEIVKNQC